MKLSAWHSKISITIFEVTWKWYLHFMHIKRMFKLYLLWWIFFVKWYDIITEYHQIFPKWTIACAVFVYAIIESQKKIKLERTLWKLLCCSNSIHQCFAFEITIGIFIIGFFFSFVEFPRNELNKNEIICGAQILNERVSQLTVCSSSIRTACHAIELWIFVFNFSFVHTYTQWSERLVQLI